MYKVIGADGKEYGPAAAELLRTWLQEGRITFQSRARLEGTEEWKLLSEFPEFGESEGETRPQAPPAATSLLGSADADAIANDILAEDYHLDIGSCLSRGWDLVTANFWPLVGASLLTFVLVVASSSVPFASLFLAYVFMGGLDWYVFEANPRGTSRNQRYFCGLSILVPASDAIQHRRPTPDHDRADVVRAAWNLPDGGMAVLHAADHHGSKCGFLAGDGVEQESG